MSNNIKIILSAVIAIAVVSLLFLVVPITATFVTSYIFTIIGIISVALSLGAFGKTGVTKLPQGHGFVYIASAYLALNVVFSFFAYNYLLPVKWTAVVHAAMFGVFLIIVIATISGSEHVNKVESNAKAKHEEFKKEKENYWK